MKKGDRFFGIYENTNSMSISVLNKEVTTEKSKYQQLREKLRIGLR